jgi:CRISPR-associated protein Cas5t
MLKVKVECPMTSFPRPLARDYKDTYLEPPLPTVHGFLLSLIGERDKTAHSKARLSIVMDQRLEYLAQCFGNKDTISSLPGGQTQKRKAEHGVGVYPTTLFGKPNFVEILTNVNFVVEINSELETREPTLESRVKQALLHPESITRFGGLSLGPSWALVNVVELA